MDACPCEMKEEKKKIALSIFFFNFLNISKYINKAKINLKSFGLAYYASAL